MKVAWLVFQDAGLRGEAEFSVGVRGSKRAAQMLVKLLKYADEGTKYRVRAYVPRPKKRKSPVDR